MTEIPDLHTRELHKMTRLRLIESGCAHGEAELFNERHVQLDPRPAAATSQDVLQAHDNLGLIGEPWPSPAESPRQILRVQAELDRMLLHPDV